MAMTTNFRVSATLVLAAIVAAIGGPSFAQTAPAANPIADVRQTLDAARKDIATYKTAGGAAGVPDHPAVKWADALWAYRDRHPGTDAAAMGTSEAIRLLVRAELWDRARTRVDSLNSDDAAWERLAAVIYEEGIARKDLPSAIAKLSRVAAATTSERIKAAALLTIGRAYRRQGDDAAASKSLEAAKTAAPDTQYAKDAEGVLYEIKHLSVGLQAPPISGDTRTGQPVTLDGFRGKAVVLVFWGTT